MMIEDLQQYIGERAENLAIMHLTRRSDLAVQQMAHVDTGLDLFVEILEDQKPSGKVFGIQLKARETLAQSDSPASLIKNENLQHIQKLPFPLCVFLFEMEGDRGFYTWLKSPNLAEHPQVPKDWCLLTPTSLNEIITLVTTWYEQKQQLAA